MLEPIPFSGYMEIDNMNKPVAWMLVTGHGTKILEKKPYCEIDYWKPLYTHPVKELTDAEEALRFLYEAIIRYENLSLFPDKYAVESCEYQLHDAKEKARAILRKAQENE